MRAVVQRTKQTRLFVDGQLISGIQAGLVVYFGVAVGDTFDQADYLAKKIANMRIIEDDNGVMESNLEDEIAALLNNNSSTADVDPDVAKFQQLFN